MYNEILKEEFLNSENRFQEPTKVALRKIFDMSEEVECKLGKDLSDFNNEDVVQLISVVSTGDSGIDKRYVDYYSMYYNWCNKDKADLEDPFALTKVGLKFAKERNERIFNKKVSEIFKNKSKK